VAAGSFVRYFCAPFVAILLWGVDSRRTIPVHHCCLMGAAPNVGRPSFFALCRKNNYGLIWRKEKRLFIFEPSNNRKMKDFDFTQYSEQLTDLMGFIQARGLTFSTPEELNQIMVDWLNHGTRVIAQLQQPAVIDSMYRKMFA
jgi:hypothetical protein